MYCVNCGFEFEGNFCPNCGARAFSSASVTEQLDNIEDESMEVAGLSSAMIESYKVLPIASKKIGPVQIDERNHLFRIKGVVPKNGHKDGLGKKLIKGSMAVGTLGMSVATEKALGIGGNKVGNRVWLEYSDLISYELIENNKMITSGGVGQALIGGAVFGAPGAIAGAITGKRKTEKKIESLYIKVTVNNFSSPSIMIPLITKSVKTKSKEYKNAFQLAHQILSALDVIAHNK